MITYEDAKTRVLKLINDAYNSSEDELIIREEATIEKKYGWIFFYNSRRYLETEEISYFIGGNGPIIVERDSGNIVRLITACSSKESIAEYERQRNLT
jgi:hypothetical protein